MNTNRRFFLKQSSSLLGCLFSISNLNNQTQRASKSILLRSSWQTINIGDIGHTPGVLALIEKYLPEFEVRLWAGDIKNGVEEMLIKRFPNVPIIKSSDKDALELAFKECDFLLHGSGPYLVATQDITKWYNETRKPFGIYGITLNEDRATPDAISMMNKSQFIFFRDSFSLEYCKKIGINCPIMEFGPDCAFGVDLKNDDASKKFMHNNGLKEGGFLCVIPRYRFVPNWKIPSKNATINKDKNDRNELMKEHDHKPLREAIIAVIRQTNLKILICPEDVTQVELGKKILYDPLPEDVKKRVVWRSTYWLTDEALSTYTRSVGLFGNEMHSPIMCIGNGIPAIVCRFHEQTSKGIMWKDIGLGEWLFDLDVEKEIDGIVPAVLEMAKNPKLAKKKALKARDLVNKYQQKNISNIKK